MNIVIQGPQGEGKTSAANKIQTMYLPEAVLVLVSFKKKYEAKIIKHLQECRKAGNVPLIIFEDLYDDDLIAAINCKARIATLGVTPRIDTIFITQYKFNISKK